MSFKCYFMLQLFPFGNQTCYLHIQPLIEAPKEAFTIIAPMEANNSKLLLPSEEGGEYIMISIEHFPSNHRIMLKLSLKSCYEYYILNNFVPSTLIFIISYSSFFFPLSNFNERVMVSLTSLLVLASFFTQASDYSVHTTYPKMLDIWFIFLIIENFSVVVLNVIINNIYLRSIKNQTNKIHVKEAFKIASREPVKLVSVNAERVNVFAKIFVPTSWCFFFLWYVLTAVG